MTMSRTLAFLAIGLLTVAGVATVVAAQDGQHGGKGPPSDHQGPPPGEARREAAREKAQEIRNRTADLKQRLQQLCGDDNATAALNDSEQAACDKIGQFRDKEFKARREAHALIGALDALERRIGRLTVRLHVLNAELASGNFTGNDTATSVQSQINATQAQQDKMVERVLEMRQRLDALHEKWAAVREHVADERHHGALGDPADIPQDDGPDSGALEGSSSVSSSASGTSSAAA